MVLYVLLSDLRELNPFEVIINIYINAKRNTLSYGLYM